jgi:AraC-like DNA-binding protein/quercetin dioxygenase-like cupin family protein
MQPVPFKIQKSKAEALKIQIDKGTSFYGSLHYHPEYQLTMILKGRGILYAGNSNIAFNNYDLFLIGSNVPHLFKNISDGNNVKSVSLFFSKASFGPEFFDVTEMKNLKKVVAESQRVIKLEMEPGNKLTNKFAYLNKKKNHHLLILFLEMLDHLSHSSYEYVNELPLDHLPSEAESSRLGTVLNFILENYRSEISVSKIAKIAHLSNSQFSYFFKLHTNKTFVQFLNEVRIENACNALKDQEKNIETICYESGFNNISYFVRLFKKVKGTTPSKYRNTWLQT